MYTVSSFLLGAILSTVGKVCYSCAQPFLSWSRSTITILRSVSNGVRFRCKKRLAKFEFPCLYCDMLRFGLVFWLRTLLVVFMQNIKCVLTAIFGCHINLTRPLRSALYLGWNCTALVQSEANNLCFAYCKVFNHLRSKLWGLRQLIGHFRNTKIWFYQRSW